MQVAEASLLALMKRYEVLDHTASAPEVQSLAYCSRRPVRTSAFT